MIPLGCGETLVVDRIPRESGDDPNLLEIRPAGHQVFPARAGMIRTTSTRRRQQRRIPRESGDDPSQTTTTPTPSKYSPRERG